MITVAALAYWASIGVRRHLGPFAVAILLIAVFYCAWVLFARPYERFSSFRYGAVTAVLDAGLVTLWCGATGGPHSEFWTLYLIVVMSVAIRYRPVEVIGAACCLSVLYVSVATAGGGLPLSSLLLRPALILVAGAAGALLADQVQRSRDEREAFRRMAERSTATVAEARQRVDHLQEMDRQRSDVLATVSHELRTPLTGILGALSTLRKHGARLDESTRDDLLDNSQVQASRLARLVEDLLTVSRIEDGVTLDIRTVSAGELARDALRASGTEAMAEVHADDVRVACDEDCCVRILTNLLDNARKYSPGGETIELLVSGEPGLARFSVRDGGPGIPQADRARIFEKYARSESAGEVKGTGLGLYIAKHLVELHGGDISVGDAPRGGAEFSFTLPRAADEPTDSRAIPSLVRQS